MQIKCVGHHVQQIARLQLRAGQGRHPHICFFKTGQDIADQGCLTGPRPTGNRDETFTLQERIIQVGLGIGITAVTERKAVIRAQPERLARQLIIGSVYIEHSLYNSRSTPRTAYPPVANLLINNGPSSP